MRLIQISQTVVLGLSFYVWWLKAPQILGGCDAQLMDTVLLEQTICSLQKPLRFFVQLFFFFFPFLFLLVL